MSIEQTQVIDAIGIDTESKNIVLTISDHLEWTNPNHLTLLQEKLNRYLAFIESGELLETYSDATDKIVLIRLVYQYIPNEEGNNFLGQVSTIVENAGYQFDYTAL